MHMRVYDYTCITLSWFPLHNENLSGFVGYACMVQFHKFKKLCGCISGSRIH